MKQVCFFIIALLASAVSLHAQTEAKKAPFIAVMSETEPGVMSYVCAIPDDLLRPVSIALNKRLNGRGGGAKGFVQGSWKADETAVREAVAAVWAEHTA